MCYFNSHIHLLIDYNKAARDCYMDQLLASGEPCLLEISSNYCEWTIFP